MAGILDPKTRILDFIITPQGKKALAEKGEFVPSFVSFADDKVYYAKLSKTGSVADDASARLSVQANSFDKDSLFSMSGSLLFEEKSQFTAAKRSEVLLSNLRNLRILQSVPSYLVGETDFNISPTSLSVVPESSDVDVTVTEDISNLSAVFQDKHFQHIDNYHYMPPVNSISGEPLGDYPKINTDEIFTITDLHNVLQYKKKEVIKISGGIQPRNLIFRIFETDDVLGKSSLLEIIDYGSYTNNEGLRQHVFFVGKIFDDLDDVPVFVNIFTMVFS
jgi:hypothetical protein